MSDEPSESKSILAQRACLSGKSRQDRGRKSLGLLTKSCDVDGLEDAFLSVSAPLREKRHLVIFTRCSSFAGEEQKNDLAQRRRGAGACLLLFVQTGQRK